MQFNNLRRKFRFKFNDSMGAWICNKCNIILKSPATIKDNISELKCKCHENIQSNKH